MFWIHSYYNAYHVFRHCNTLKVRVAQTDWVPEATPTMSVTKLLNKYFRFVKPPPLMLSNDL
jgi:hypothetical protein